MTDEEKKQPKRIVQNRTIDLEYKPGTSGWASRRLNHTLLTPWLTV